jgi:hypothetical protein
MCSHVSKLQYFGEWFMTLRAMMAAQKSFFDSWRPMVRWLQKIVSKELDDYKTEPDRIPLNDLHVFCSKNPDLPRSFLLASICREAISVSSGQKESKTYGQITRADCGKFTVPNNLCFRVWLFALIIYLIPVALLPFCHL